MQLDAAAIHSSAELPPPRQYDWWRDAVSATHLPWDLPRRLEGGYRAKFRQQGIGAAQIVHCACDPCEGKRGKAEIAQLKEPLFGVLYVLKGRESLRQGGREIVLEQGAFTLWDSARPIEFGLPQDLEKITLLLPQASLREYLPQAEDLVMRPVSGQRGAGALFATHLRALAREGATLPVSGAAPVLRATLDLLATSFMAMEVEGGNGYRRAMRRRIQDFVLANLADPALCAEVIAAAVGISERQLHRLFQIGGMTLVRWIWQQRLQRCREDLARAPHARISEIAFAHGFSDAAHFSRAFRDMFGMSPRDFRKSMN